LINCLLQISRQRGPEDSKRNGASGSPQETKKKKGKRLKLRQRVRSVTPTSVWGENLGNQAWCTDKSKLWGRKFEKHKKSGLKRKEKIHSGGLCFGKTKPILHRMGE